MSGCTYIPIIRLYIILFILIYINLLINNYNTMFMRLDSSYSKFKVMIIVIVPIHTQKKNYLGKRFF